MKMSSIKMMVTTIILATSISSVFALVPFELSEGAPADGLVRVAAPLATIEDDPVMVEEAAAAGAAAEVGG